MYLYLREIDPNSPQANELTGNYNFKHFHNAYMAGDGTHVGMFVAVLVC